MEVSAQADVIVRVQVGDIPVRVQGVENAHLLAVHDEVLHGGGNAVGALALVHRLHIVMLHSGGQRRRPAHRLRQSAQKGHVPAGGGKGRKQVHQQYKGCKANRQTACRDAEKTFSVL